MPKTQFSLRDKKLAFKERKGMKRMPHFKAVSAGHGQEPAPRIIYANHNAVPVSGSAKDYFSTENIERVSIGNEITHGGGGIIYAGRIKFKKGPVKKAAVKMLLASAPEISPSVIIEKLKKSRVSHPKMAFLESGMLQFIIMEPFVSTSNGRIITKFQEEGDFIRSLDLKNRKDLNAFRQAAMQTLQLARQGLYIRPVADDFGARADVFNAINLKNGKKKVFVQDIDTFSVESNPKKCFWKSAEHLLRTVTALKQENQSIANRIIVEIAEQNGF